MAAVSLQGLAKQWEAVQSIRRRVRDTGSAFAGRSGAVPTVNLKDAAHNKDVLLPALTLMRQAAQPGKLFQISAAEAECLGSTAVTVFAHNL